jgi:hypothetical protein
MTDRRWLVGCGIAGALLAAALSWDFFALSLDPWPDQAWILLAAERHHRGLGLTTTLDSSSTDLAVTDYHRLTYFPPGYPLLVSALRTTGASIQTIVKTINALALVAGFIGWMWLAGLHLTSRVPRLLFALLLALACRGTIPRGGTTDYVFWALLPFWFLLMERRRLAWAGVVVAVMIGFRWAAVVLIPAGVLLEVIGRAEARRYSGRMPAVGLYALIPGLTFGGISLVNRVLSERASILSYVETSWRFDLLATLYPFESAFARPTGIEPLLSRFARALPAAGIVFRVVIPLLLIVLLARSVKLDRFGRLVALVYVCLIGLLAYMTVRHAWGGVNWSYLEEPRYYMPFFPALALFWLRVPRKWWLGLLAVAILYLGQAEARWTMTRLRAGEPDAGLLEQLDAIRNLPGRHDVFDSDISRYLIWDSDRFSPRLYPASADSLHSSAPVEVWIVERLEQKTAYVADPQYDRKRLDALLACFRPALAWSDARFRLYRATVFAPPPARGAR